MFSPSKKKALIGFLSVCFLGQTALVYSDQREDPLSEAAIRGRVLYHDYACQVCHQLYGQGGFLGPDLTNAASRVDPDRLRSLLTVGSGQMPALQFSEAQVSDLSAFLHEIDRPDLGRGQLRLGAAEVGGGPQAAFDDVVTELLISGSPEEEGFAAIAARPCSQCHFPLRLSVVGAPDLSEVAGRLSLDELRTVLTEGRPATGMPPPGPAFTAAETENVIAFLGWLADHRSEVAAGVAAAPARTVDWGNLPWWEFR